MPARPRNPPSRDPHLRQKQIRASKAARSKRVEEIVAEAIGEIDDEDITVPDDLSSRVTALLKEDPKLRWDEAVAAIVDACPAPKRLRGRRGD